MIGSGSCLACVERSDLYLAQNRTGSATLTGRQMDRQSGRQADCQTGRETCTTGWKHAQYDNRHERQTGMTGRQIDKQTDKQTDRQADMQADMQTDRQAGRHA